MAVSLKWRWQQSRHSSEGCVRTSGDTETSMQELGNDVYCHILYDLECLEMIKMFITKDVTRQITEQLHNYKLFVPLFYY